MLNYQRVTRMESAFPTQVEISRTGALGLGPATAQHTATTSHLSASWLQSWPWTNRRIIPHGFSPFFWDWQMTWSFYLCPSTSGWHFWPVPVPGTCFHRLLLAPLSFCHRTISFPFCIFVEVIQAAPASQTRCPSSLVLYPKIHNGSRCGFLPNASPMQHSCSHHLPKSPLTQVTTSRSHQEVITPLRHHKVTTSLSHHFPKSPLPEVITSLRHHKVTTSLSHHFPKSSLPEVITSLRHHRVITSLSHHFPKSPLPDVITPLRHHKVTTSLSHHFPKSSLPEVITSLRHHKVTTSLSHHFPKSPLPEVITSLRHHKVTTSRSHHLAKTPQSHHVSKSTLPQVTTSRSHHLAKTSQSHHFSKSPLL